MALFKDAKGDEWLVELDGPTMGEIRDVAKVDLADLSGNGYLKIESDAPSLVAALKIICRPQMLDRKITSEQFGKRIRKEALVDAAAAVIAAAADFFPTKAWSEALSRLEQSRAMRTQTASLGPMLSILDDPGIPERMKAAVMSAIGEMLTTAGESIDLANLSKVGSSAGTPEQMPSMPAGDSLESAASAPAA